MNCRSRGAFTLIELMVVILIIAVVSAVIVPAYGGFYAKSRFDGEIKRIQDFVAEARARAVAGDTTVTLHFERGADVFTISVDTLPQQNDLPTALLEDSGRNQIGDIDPYHVNDEFRVENFTVQGTGSANPASGRTGISDVQFRGDGTSDGAEMSILSRDGLAAHLIISPVDGQLKIDQ